MDGRARALSLCLCLCLCFVLCAGEVHTHTEKPHEEVEDTIVSFNANHIRSREELPPVDADAGKADLRVVQRATLKAEEAGRKKLLQQSRYLKKEEEAKAQETAAKDKRHQEESEKFKIELRRDDEAQEKQSSEREFKDKIKVQRQGEQQRKQARRDIDAINTREEKRKEVLVRKHKAWKVLAKKKAKSLEDQARSASEEEKKARQEEKRKHRNFKLARNGAALLARKKEVYGKNKQEASWKQERRRKQRQAANFQLQMRKVKHAHELNVKRSNREHQESITKYKRRVERASKSEASIKRSRESFVGLCAFHTKHTCPAGWTFRGLAGMIQSKATYDRNPFRAGANFNSGWRWSHPYLCCATNPRAIAAGLYVLARTCPTGSLSRGFMGVLLLNADARLNPFTRGGGYNSGWSWTHPYACWAASNKAVLAAGTCLLAQSCPTSRGWHSQGRSGVILYRGHYQLNPFSGGGAISSSWQWTHPHLCCRR